ncbi:MAG: hypothetical protein KAI40_00320 [Desulfobacterales bacterium]|nr:hypothetical protein [Desulfobacterales bacterium]
MKFNNHFIRENKYYIQTIFCALLVTIIFSIRWKNCLPFSGYMPLAANSDQLDIFARFLIWAKEPFSLPIGTIKGFTFPFEDASITRGPLPLFALLFKGLSRIYSPFSEFYYFVFAEIVFVFFAAFFTCMILDLYNIKSFSLKLLGVTLVALSFPILYRSSNYYGVTFLMAYIPLYTAFAYCYIRIYKYPSIKSFVLMAFFLPLLAFFDYYVLFGIFFMSIVSLPLIFINYLINRNIVNRKRFYGYLISLVIGTSLLFGLISLLGKQGDLTVPSQTTLTHRNEVGWGYGGGYGGGFHVADVLTLIIPPRDNIVGAPEYKICGPSAYLTKLGFPLTADKLQDGQYEGFTYIGTTTLGIIVFLSILGFIFLIKNRKLFIVKLKMNISNKLFGFNDPFSLSFIVGISTFALFVFSWGYIIHFGGNRFNNIGTPTLFLAELWNKFMLARGLGRLAIPFMLFCTFGSLILFSKIVSNYMCRTNTIKKAIIITTIVLLSVFHVFEIRGYLKESKVVFGNEIIDVFEKEEGIKIHKILKDKKGLIFAHPIRSDDEWLKTCYSLGFHSMIPISGIYSGMTVNQNHRVQTDINRQNARTGHIREIIELYGDVAFAAPCEMADDIIKRSNVPLQSYKIEKKNVTLIFLDN